MSSTNKPVRGNTFPSCTLRVMGVALFFLSTTSFAAAQQPPGGDRERRGPPPEAFAACEFQNVDDACSIALADEALSGTCVVARGPKRRGNQDQTQTEIPAQTSEQTLICKPEGHRPPRGGERGESRPDESDSE